MSDSGTAASLPPTFDESAALLIRSAALVGSVDGVSRATVVQLLRFRRSTRALFGSSAQPLVGYTKASSGTAAPLQTFDESAALFIRSAARRIHESVERYSCSASDVL